MLDEIKELRGAVDQPNERDYLAEHLFGAFADVELPSSVNLNVSPSHNQGTIWSCTAVGLVHCEEILNSLEFQPVDALADPLEQWNHQKLDAGPVRAARMDKEGDSLQNALNTLVKYGLKNKSQSIPVEKFQITGYARVKNDLESVKQWLAAGSPIYTGWYKHCFALVGYDESRKVLLAKNSYGPTWGKKGDGTFDIDYSDFSKLFSKYIIYDIKDLKMIFKDVSEDSPMAKNIKRMLDLGLVRGYGDAPNAVDRFFMPEKPVSRAEICEILGNFIDKFNLK